MDGAPRSVTHRRTSRRHGEPHASARSGWLRAGVLGANDGLLSTAGLLVGVASASASSSVLLATGVASIVAGAGSMAVGEYSSVSSQRDAERADLRREAEELRDMPNAELRELTGIYERRGLDRELARTVAEALMAEDALAAHARDELGLDPQSLARPVQAAVTSAVSFSLGALLPLGVVLLVTGGARVPALVAVTIVGLAALGVLGARLGHAPLVPAAFRVAIGGIAAMGLAAAVGRLFDVAVT
jgi:VIT1/CCC1 family predicted Fe2+/Mn2+ transporter